MDKTIDNFFFADDRLIRLSTDDTPLKKSPQREIKLAAQSRLVVAMTEFTSMKPAASLIELAYAFHRGIIHPPVCLTCGNQTKFSRNSWASFCSTSCQMLNQTLKAVRTEKAIEKWGVAHQFNRADVQQKRQDNFAESRIKQEHARLELVAAQQRREQKRAAAKEQRYLKSISRREAYNAQLESIGFESIEFGARFKVISATHKKCKTVFKNPRLPLQCFICDAPAKETGQWRFTQLLGEQFTRNKRIAGGKYQLDAYWEEKKLAVEYNGLYWHSAAPKPGNGRTVSRFYHQDKMLAAKQEGIRLITVWEDRAREDGFKKHFQNLFSPTKVNARACDIIMISSKERNQFMLEHHRDGDVRGASVDLGLMQNNELIMVASFGKNRFKGDGWELYRLASKTGVIIRGGVSRIISAFRKTNTETLTTYSDACWGWGDGYLKAGGELKGLTKPGYFYFDQKTGRRLHRLALSRGSFFKTTGLEWDLTLNEAENAARFKCWQVWDCGNWKFVWDTEKNCK